MKKLFKEHIETPLGKVIAIADEQELYFLDFEDVNGIEKKLERFQKRAKTEIVEGSSPCLKHLKKELQAFFKGSLQEFSTPVALLGSPFQHKVWNALKKIPLGTTKSYQDLAKVTGNGKAYRAVARANATNNIVLVIPCHRVINANGKLGGYSSGLERKEWLLSHEKKLLEV